LLIIGNPLQTTRILTVSPPVRRLKPDTRQNPPPPIANKIATKTQKPPQNRCLLYTALHQTGVEISRFSERRKTRNPIQP
jgi:hypothetical protein